MEADKMLDVYIYDYLIKRKLSFCAKIFQAEAKVSMDCVAIDAPAGFLLEWWSVFWDIFIARYKPGSLVAGTSSGVQITDGAEQKLHQQHNLISQQQQLPQQTQLQQLILQKQFEQHQRQRRRDMQLQTSPNNYITSQNPMVVNSSATRVHEELLESNRNRNAGQLSTARLASMSGSADITDKHMRQALGMPDVISGDFGSKKDQSQQLLMSQDLKTLINPVVKLGAASLDGAFTAVTGLNQGLNNIPLKGFPLMGVKQQNAVVDCSQLQIQKQIRMLFNDQSMDMKQDHRPDIAGNTIPTGYSQVPVGFPILTHGDAELLMKLYQQQPDNNNQNAQHVLAQHLETTKPNVHQQDRMVTGGTLVDATLSSTRECPDQNLKKRKQPMSSSAPADSSGTANVAGPSPSSTSSTYTTKDMILVPTLSHDTSSLKNHMDGSNDALRVSSVPNQTQKDVDHLLNNGSVDDSVESYLSNENADSAKRNDSIIVEIQSILTETVDCCDFSSDGRLIATGGCDKKVLVWNVDSREQEYIFAGHSNAITDIRFGPRMTRLASSSTDKTVRIWDLDNPGNSLQTFAGHSASVLSVDFHPKKEDLICSCDNNAIRYWSIRTGSCAGMSRIGATQLRFQPSRGKYLAAVGDGVSILDVETNQTCRYPLVGHASKTQSVCWSPCGEYLASLSIDSVRVWKIGSWGKQQSMHILKISGKEYRCCTFHPRNPSILVVGSHQSLELWHMTENKMMNVLEEPTAILAASQAAALVASASNDNIIKLWK